MINNQEVEDKDQKVYSWNKKLQSEDAAESFGEDSDVDDDGNVILRASTFEPEEYVGKLRDRWDEKYKQWITLTEKEIGAVVNYVIDELSEADKNDPIKSSIIIGATGEYAYAKLMNIHRDFSRPWTAPFDIINDGYKVDVKTRTIKDAPMVLKMGKLVQRFNDEESKKKFCPLGLPPNDEVRINIQKHTSLCKHMECKRILRCILGVHPEKEFKSQPDIYAMMFLDKGDGNWRNWRFRYCGEIFWKDVFSNMQYLIDWSDNEGSLIVAQESLIIYPRMCDLKLSDRSKGVS